MFNIDKNGHHYQQLVFSEQSIYCLRLSTRYDLSYTIVILTYDNECSCHIFLLIRRSRNLKPSRRVYSITYARVRIVYDKSYHVDMPLPNNDIEHNNSDQEQDDSTDNIESPPNNSDSTTSTVFIFRV